MSTISSASSLFTGTSQFSAQLQKALQTAITAASQPLTQMQTDLTTLQSQQSELNTLNSDFTNLQTAVANVASAAGSSSYAASLSDSAVASVSLSGTPELGSLSLDVTSMGSDTSMSSDGLTTVTDPTTGNIGDATNYTLTVGSSSTTITPAALRCRTWPMPSIKAERRWKPWWSISGRRVHRIIGSLSRAPSWGSGDSTHRQRWHRIGGSIVHVPDHRNGSTYQVNGEPSASISTSSSTVTLASGVTATIDGAGTPPSTLPAPRRG